MLTDDELITQAWPSVAAACIEHARRTSDNPEDAPERSMAGMVLKLRRELERLRARDEAAEVVVQAWQARKQLSPWCEPAQLMVTEPVAAVLDALARTYEEGGGGR